MSNFTPGAGTTAVGVHRDRYSAEVEPRPSRFSVDYAAWAERADAWEADS